MGVLNMLKDRKAYKELVLRRDICRFIFKLRFFEHSKLAASEKGGYDSSRIYEHFKLYGNLTEELKGIMTRATSLGVNPNYAYQYDLAKRCYAMDKTLTPEEKEQVNIIGREISNIIWLCSDPKSLCSELMTFSLHDEIWHLIDPETLRNTILTLLKYHVPYSRKSKEHTIISMKKTNLEWYETYFFKADAREEDRLADVEFFFSKTMEGNIVYREILMSIIPIIQKNNVPYTKEQIIYMIECDRKLLAKALNNGFCTPFSFKDYLDELMDELTTGKKKIDHHPKSPFASEVVPTEEVAKLFSLGNIVLFQKMYRERELTLLSHLAYRLARLDDGDTIAFAIDKSIGQNPENERVRVAFGDKFLTEKDKLRKSRQNLTLVLKQIADKRQNISL